MAWGAVRRGVRPQKQGPRPAEGGRPLCETGTLPRRSQQCQVRERVPVHPGPGTRAAGPAWLGVGSQPCSLPALSAVAA